MSSQRKLAALGIFAEPRLIGEIPLDELLGIAVRHATLESEDLCIGEAMEGLDWVTEEHIQALCRAGGQAVLAALAAAGLSVVDANTSVALHEQYLDLLDNSGVTFNDMPVSAAFRRLQEIAKP